MYKNLIRKVLKRALTIVTTIAVCNQKGGVAKTTTCLSLGAGLAELGCTVLLLDLDPQAHLTLSLGLKPEKLTHTIGDALLSNTSLLSVICESGVFGLDIVPANQELSLIDKFLYGHKEYEFHLQRQLERLEPGLFDYIVLDCPPAFGTLTLNALTAANLLLMPAPCEYYGVQSLYRTIRLARLVQEKTNPCLSYRALVTMYDRRSRLGRLILAQMQQQLGSILCQTVIEVDARLKESPAYGQPVTVYAPKTRGAQQYRALAQELSQNCQLYPCAHEINPANLVVHHQQ